MKRTLLHLVLLLIFLKADGTPLSKNQVDPDADASAANPMVPAPEDMINPMQDGLYSTYLKLHERLRHSLVRSARNETMLRTQERENPSEPNQSEARTSPPSADPATIPAMKEESDATIFWTTTGNVRPESRPLYLGTLDRSPLVMGANGRIALRVLVPPESPNLLGGHPANSIRTGTVGAAIGGGGAVLSPNQVNGDYGVVAGGLNNQAGGPATHLDTRFATVGGGMDNQAWGGSSTVAGGSQNLAHGRGSTIGGGAENRSPFEFTVIGGGLRNTVRAPFASVGGGNTNVVSGKAGTAAGGEHNQVTGAGGSVGGGLHNTASGMYAAIPGGTLNLAAGTGSLAAGTMAEARHDGSFVWADRQGLAFTTSTNNQFLVRAAGNMGVDTASPMEKLTVRGNIAPADTRQHDLGAPDLMWRHLFLSDGIRTPEGFTVTRDNTPLLILTPEGDLRIRGRIIGNGFETNNGAPLPREASTASQPPRGGTSLTRESRLDGDVTGTPDNLKLKPGRVTGDIIGTDAVHGGHIRSSTLTSRHIEDASIRPEDLDLASLDKRYLTPTQQVQNQLVAHEDELKAFRQEMINRLEALPFARGGTDDPSSKNPVGQDAPEGTSGIEALRRLIEVQEEALAQQKRDITALRAEVERLTRMVNDR